jgi:hypothetical protein
MAYEPPHGLWRRSFEFRVAWALEPKRRLGRPVSLERKRAHCWSERDVGGMIERGEMSGRSSTTRYSRGVRRRNKRSHWLTALGFGLG